MCDRLIEEAISEIDAGWVRIQQVKHMYEFAGSTMPSGTFSCNEVRQDTHRRITDSIWVDENVDYYFDDEGHRINKD